MRNVNLEYGVNLPKRGFVHLSAMLLMGAGALALPGAALALTGQPLAYVKNNGTSTISVIDTGDNHVVDTVPVGSGPGNVAVTPDGKFVYVLNSQSVSVIETVNQIDKVVATIPIGQFEGRGGISSGATGGIAVTPDGKSVYFGANNCPSPDWCRRRGGGNSKAA